MSEQRTEDQDSCADVSASAHDPGHLGRAVRRGAKASALVLVVTQLVSLGQTLLIARLLTPAEVGLFSAGTVLAAVLMTVSEGGLRNAIVQRESGDVESASETVFWASLATSTVWAAITIAVAPLVGWVFGDPQAGLITAVTAGTIVMHGLTYVPDSLMQRRLDIRQRLIVPPAISLGFAVTAVVFAALGYGVWSLVIGSYVSHLAWILASWSLAGWRPRRARFSFRLWREMARFAFPLVLSNLGERGRELVETVVVGRWLGESSLGYFRYGRKLATLPSVAVIEVFSYVLLPAFSRIANDPVRFREVFLRTLLVLWCVSLPLAGLLIVIGEQATTLLLGEQWRPAGTVLVAMSGVGPGVAICAVGTEAMKGCGRSRLLNWLTLTSVLVGLSMLALLLPLGLLGVGLAISVDSLACGLLALVLARQVVDVRFREMLALMVPAMLATAVAMAVVGWLRISVLDAGSWHPAAGLLTLLGAALVFAVLFASVMFVIAPRQSRAIVRSARMFVRPSAGA